MVEGNSWRPHLFCMPQQSTSGLTLVRLCNVLYQSHCQSLLGSLPGSHPVNLFEIPESHLVSLFEIPESHPVSLFESHLQSGGQQDLM